MPVSLTINYLNFKLKKHAYVLHNIERYTVVQLYKNYSTLQEGKISGSKGLHTLIPM
jgi:hypothetical protein